MSQSFGGASHGRSSLRATPVEARVPWPFGPVPYGCSGSRAAAVRVRVLRPFGAVSHGRSGLRAMPVRVCVTPVRLRPMAVQAPCYARSGPSSTAVRVRVRQPFGSPCYARLKPRPTAAFGLACCGRMRRRIMALDALAHCGRMRSPATALIFDTRLPRLAVPAPVLRPFAPARCGQMQLRAPPAGTFAHRQPAPSCTVNRHLRASVRWPASYGHLCWHQRLDTPTAL